MTPLEKMGLLEQQVTKMVQLIKDLRTQKQSLDERVADLNNQVQVMSQDLEHSRQEVNNLAQLKDDNQRFQEERGQVYDKLETMLSGLETIGI